MIKNSRFILRTFLLWNWISKVFFILRKMMMEKSRSFYHRMIILW